MNELRTALEEYLAIRRALGFNLRQAGDQLRDFVNFAEKEKAPFITTQLALRWATRSTNCRPEQWTRRLDFVRVFAQYRSASDPRTEIPPRTLLSRRYRRKTPYVYSHDEISRLIDAAKHLWSPRGLRASTYSTLYGLMAVTGMRVSEPIGLDREDVDLTRGALTVRHSKFNKSRLVPIHPTTRDALRQYECLRKKIFPKPPTPSFFISERGARVTIWSVERTFVKLSHQIGLREPTDTHGPRLHDLRHSFAVHTLTAWYQKDIDVERRLPELSTYLGHGGVALTYWYLSATPDLLQMAALRLERKKGGILS